MSTHAHNAKKHINLKKENEQVKFCLNKMAIKDKKTVKKKFLIINVPLINREIEVYGADLNSFNNQFINLDLTSDLKGKAIELKLKINATENKAEAYPIQLQLMGFNIRRMMRKGVDYVEDSFVVKCKDNNIRIKPFLITRKRVSKKVLAGLRNLAKAEMTNYAKDKNFEDIILDIVNNKIQKDLSVKLKKIYPLSLCEIRFLGLEKQKRIEIQKIKEDNKEIKLKEIEA